MILECYKKANKSEENSFKLKKEGKVKKGKKGCC